MSGLRNALRLLAADKREWAGIPMPLDGHPLIVEPTYPKAEALMRIGHREPEAPELADATIRNRFWSWNRRCTVVVWEKDGRIDWGLERHHPIDLAIATLGASDAWGIEQESNAVHTLGTLLRHRQFKQYLLTGMFMETSPRSGVTYLFRRLRPTLALSSKSGKLKVLCALCLHPIGYYEDSFAGAMCPTDDVIAHLMLSRAILYFTNPPHDVGCGS